MFCPRKAWGTHLQHPRLCVHTYTSIKSYSLPRLASSHQAPLSCCLLGDPPVFLQRGGPHPTTGNRPNLLTSGQE